MNGPRAAHLMAEHGLDVLVATSPANIAYLTGYAVWFDGEMREDMLVPGGRPSLLVPGFAVLVRDLRPILIAPAGWVANGLGLDIGELHVFGGLPFDGELPPLAGPFASVLDALGHRHHADAPTALVAVLAAHGLDRGRIGVELGFDARQREAFAELLPHAALGDATNLFRLARAVKTAAETALLATATQLTWRAYREAAALARPGFRTAELRQAYRSALGRLGADVDHLALSPDGLGMTTSADYPLPADAALYVDFGARLGGYCSDAGTTLELGDVPVDLAAARAAVVEAVRAGAAELRPGMLASAACAAMREALRARGLPDGLAHGHGIGVELRDHPLVAPAGDGRIRDDFIDVPADLPLEEGMIVNLEAPIFLPGRGSVHEERTFAITAAGALDLAEEAA